MRAPVPPFDSRDNAIGALRLLLALAVLVGHVPELADGNRLREPLTALLGGLSLGEWAVDGFFFLSGWLLTASLERQPNPGAYLRARVARLYPAFLLATGLCLWIAAPLAGAAVPPGGTLAEHGVRAALLLQPSLPGAFTGLPYPPLNGALWTLPFEARCYLLLLLLAQLKLLGRPRLIGAFALAGLLMAGLVPRLFAGWSSPLWVWFILLDPDATARLGGCFLAGSAFYAARGRLRFSRPALIAASVALVGGLGSVRFGHLASATAGGYLLLAVAYGPAPAWVRAIGRRRDLSYGVYLYAWPLTNLLLFHARWLPLPVLGALVAVGALGLAWLSWTLVEAPALRLGRRTPVARAPSQGALLAT